jgi:hypothetical protein
MPSNSMRMHVEGINLEVQPVEGESLYQAQNRLPEERVDTKRYATLV